MRDPLQAKKEASLLMGQQGKMGARVELWSDRPEVSNEQRLWILLAQTGNLMLRARALELQQQDVSLMEFGVLFVLNLIGPDATPGRIARMLGRTPHSTSGLLTRMEKGGLVRKAKDMENKRMVRIVITEKGAEIYERTRGAESISQIIFALPKSEAKRKEFQSNLEMLQEAAQREVGLALAAKY